MSRLEPLQPAFDFSTAPQSVSLFVGNTELDLGDERRCVGTGAVLLQFLPKPRVVILARFSDSCHFPIDWVFNDTSEKSLFLNEKSIAGFSGRRRVSTDGAVLEWIPSTLPLNMGDMAIETTAVAIAHVFNFPDFMGGKCQGTGAPEGRSLLLLESDEWRINLQSLPGDATRDACKRIKEEGGCFLTHVAKLERKDGGPFSGEVARDQLRMLSQFLSLVLGSDCSTVCNVGFDKFGERVWEDCAAPRLPKRVQSWFHEWRADQVEQLFPLFVKRWEQSQEWKHCLEHAIYWYTQANTDGASLHIQSAIILVQAALERLAYHYAVVDRRMISDEGFKKLRVSDQLRILFVGLDIPIALDQFTPALQRMSKNKSDRPHALTDIRNSLVHPRCGEYEVGCYIDAWKLGLWYLELSILALCGYSGVYQNRLRPTPYPAQLSRVPWCKSSSD